MKGTKSFQGWLKAPYCVGLVLWLAAQFSVGGLQVGDTKPIALLAGDYSFVMKNKCNHSTVLASRMALPNARLARSSGLP